MSTLSQTELLAAYQSIRQQSLVLIEGLSAEDCMLQSMPDASPIKWHLAHVSWFFETFVLERAIRNFCAFNPMYRMLFNSYYLSVGQRHPRPERGMLSRPSLTEVLSYRRAIDEQMTALLDAGDIPEALLDVIELGLHHEQQHQELMLTDLKHHFWRNPLQPAYRPPNGPDVARHFAAQFIPMEGGAISIGHQGPGFAFDNETPRHKVWLEPFKIASHPVTNRDYLAFIADGGYQLPELWLSDGWECCEREKWQAPLYWDLNAGKVFTLHGPQTIKLDEPVCHVSYYEADAYARWAEARLPTEAEWECLAQSPLAPSRGHFADSGRHHPQVASNAELDQLFGDVWEWTQSAYLAYPGFKPAAGDVGEYNGKFMINQMVLRGGSCATPAGHTRTSYRNFFPPSTRWQFSGIRLARDGHSSV